MKLTRGAGPCTESQTKDVLMICSNIDRSRLFEEHARQIQEWMETHYTDPDLSSLLGVGVREICTSQRARPHKETITDSGRNWMEEFHRG